jgi:hypothetical protein
VVDLQVGQSPADGVGGEYGDAPAVLLTPWRRPQPPGSGWSRSSTRPLRPDLEWSEAEQHTLATIQESADRAAILRTMVEAESARPEPTRYLLFLSSELRLTESHLVRMVRTLDPHGSAVSAKSPAHQRAAQIRWYGAALSGHGESG